MALNLIKRLVFSLLVSQVSHGQDSIQKAQPFLPDIISQFPNVRDVAISADENEIYFTAQSYLGELSSIVQLKLENGKWSQPQIASFSGKYQDLEPFFSPDGLRLFFVSNRPTDNKTTKPKDYDIWFLERKNNKDKWSDPINIGTPINTTENEFYPSVSKFNTIYFTSDAINPKGKDDIFMSKWKNEKYEIPTSLGDSINSDGHEFNAFISPDESFLLYTCYNRKDGLGSGDLYISYNKGNGQWSTAKNLGKEINSAQMDYCPYVNIKSGVLYFTSKRSGLNMQFGKPYTITELKKEMNKYENGLSRLYQAKTNTIIKKEGTK
jgi:hypothetical protein